jgi:hypothetical protein
MSDGFVIDVKLLAASPAATVDSDFAATQVEDLS